VQKNSKNQSSIVESSIDFDDIDIIIDNLSVDKRQKLVQKLLGQDSGLIVILDNSNIINSIVHSIAILNESSAEDIFQLLKNIPPQAIEKLIEARIPRSIW
jgi:hypothetical protein